MDPLLQDGALIDTRLPQEKEDDIQFQEIASSPAPVVWTEKPSLSWRKFPIFNQDGSGSCVAQTASKMQGILYYLKNGIYVHFSASHIYKRRANAPAPGMAGHDVFNIMKEGTTLEVLAPSQDLSDLQMDSVKIEPYKEEVGRIFKTGEPVYGPTQDIDTVASIIQKTGKGVMVWYYFLYPEWTDVPVVLDPSLTLTSFKVIRHSVTAVDYTLYQNQKALIIEDSWGPQFGKGGQRIITEEFHRSRNWFTAHVMNFKFEDVPVLPQPLFPLPSPSTPHHSFPLDLGYGLSGGDIKALQDILKYESLFPSNIESTGYFGAVTKTAVKKFQSKYDISPVSGFVGPLTRAKLNALYSR